MSIETIDRRRLIEKLKIFGFQQRVIQWFEGYLQERSQRTKVNGHYSDPAFNDLGVPQGSVLGAILFILYINDMPHMLKSSFINLFADDTLIYVYGNDCDDLRRRLNEDLERINEWLRLNKLKLNVSKTKCLVIGNSSKKFAINSIIMDGEEIGIVNQIKYLGIIIDHKLDFKDNADSVCKKVGKKIGVLSRLARNLTVSARKSIYTAVIAPHFDYCSTLLFLCNDSYFEKLQMLQSRAMRIVLGCRRYTSRKSMIEALNWLTVKQRVFYNTDFYSSTEVEKITRIS